MTFLGGTIKIVNMDFDGIVLKVDDHEFKHNAPYDIKLLGKPMKEWVGIALGANVKYINYKNSQDLISVIKPLAAGGKYTVVLYSDTPLITRATVAEALDYIEDTSQNVIKLVRGYVFRTEFLKNCDKLYAPQTYYCGDDDFIYAPDFSQLAVISDILKSRVIRFHMNNGVHFVDPATTYVDAEVSIGSGVTVFPNNTLKGNTAIGDNVTLFAGNVIENSIIGEGARLTSSNLVDATVGARTSVGPYAYLRPHSVVGADCRIGDFVELKNCKIGDESKVSHLAYVGDAEMGKGCNIGCGVVFVNYDGKNKNKIFLGDKVFVGSNSNLIAPLTLASHAYIAAGSTINESVPENALAIARERQTIKPNWNKDKF